MKKLLCFRCEHRTRCLEQKCLNENLSAPRYECKELETSVTNCYAYQPVKQPILKRSESEKIYMEQTGIDRGIGGYWGGRMCVDWENDDKFKHEIKATMLNDENFIIFDEILKT